MWRFNYSNSATYQKSRLVNVCHTVPDVRRKVYLDTAFIKDNLNFAKKSIADTFFFLKSYGNREN